MDERHVSRALQDAYELNDKEVREVIKALRQLLDRRRLRRSTERQQKRAAK